MKKLMQFEFKLPAGCTVGAVTIAEIDGHAEKRARFRSADTEGQLAEELLAESLVEVDGQKVELPYYGFLDWTSKTLDYVRTYFGKMNGGKLEAVQAELDRFDAWLATQGGPASVSKSGEQQKAAS